MQTKCVQKSSKPAKNGRICRPTISSSKWGASLLKVTYGFLWLWSSYFSLTAAQYNTHELFNSSLPNQMGIFSPQLTFWLSLYRTIQVIPASKSNPRVKFQSVKMKWTQRKLAMETTNDRSFLLRSDQLVTRKGGKYRQLVTIHGPIGMQRRLCGRDTAQPMKNNTCKN